MCTHADECVCGGLAGLGHAAHSSVEGQAQRKAAGTHVSVFLSPMSIGEEQRQSFDDALETVM